MKNYKYVGNGMGVPGLPHEVSDDAAAELGVLHILNDAIENGSYVLVDAGLDTGREDPAPTQPRVTKVKKENHNG